MDSPASVTFWFKTTTDGRLENAISARLFSLLCFSLADRASAWAASFEHCCCISCFNQAGQEHYRKKTVRQHQPAKPETFHKNKQVGLNAPVANPFFQLYIHCFHILLHHFSIFSLKLFTIKLLYM